MSVCVKLATRSAGVLHLAVAMNTPPVVAPPQHLLPSQHLHYQARRKLANQEAEDLLRLNAWRRDTPKKRGRASFRRVTANVDNQVATL